MYQFLSIFPKVYSGLITSFVSKIAGSAGEAMRTSLAALLGLVLWRPQSNEILLSGFNRMRRVLDPQQDTRSV